jgi:hypothetical protein
MIYFLIFVGIVLRFLPHAPNFTPIAALALFGGAYLNRKYALILPIAAMALSDIFIGFDSLQSRVAVYGSFLIAGLIGMWIRQNKTFSRVVGGTLISSGVFYLVTNLVLLYPPTMYDHTVAGQIASYINALPFFRSTLLGDFFYVAVLFGSYELVRLYLAQKNKQTAIFSNG